MVWTRSEAVHRYRIKQAVLQQDRLDTREFFEINPGLNLLDYDVQG